jgi:hypothetical protein
LLILQKHPILLECGGINMNALLESDSTRSLLQELTQLTGESETIAVQEAIRERLDRLHQQSASSLANRLLSLGKAAAPHFQKDAEDHLYDSNGLPQ